MAKAAVLYPGVEYLPAPEPAPPTRPRSRRATLIVVSTITVLAALAIAGAALSAGVLLRGPGAETTGRAVIAVPAQLRRLNDGTFAVGQRIPTSYGALALTHVDQLDGLTAQQMGGSMGGMGGMVMENEVQVQTTFALTNKQRHPVAFTLGAFTLISDKSDKPIPVRGATTQDGRLPAQATIEGTLSFVAPQDGAHLWIEYHDPDGRAPIRIDLGRTSQAPVDATGHDNH